MTNTIEYVPMLCGFHNLPLIFKKIKDNTLMCNTCVDETHIPKQEIRRVEVISINKSDVSVEIEKIGKSVYHWATLSYETIIKEAMENSISTLKNSTENWNNFLNCMKERQQEVINLDEEYNNAFSSIRLESGNFNAKLNVLRESIKKLKAKMHSEYTNTKEKICSEIMSQIKTELDQVFDTEFLSLKPKSDKKRKTKDKPIKDVEKPKKELPIDDEAVTDKREHKMLKTDEGQTSATDLLQSDYSGNIKQSEDGFHILIQNAELKASEMKSFNKQLFPRVAQLKTKSLALKNVLFKSQTFMPFLNQIFESPQIEKIKFSNMDIPNEVLFHLYDNLPQTNITSIAFKQCRIEILNSLKSGKLWEIVEKNYPQLTCLKFVECDVLDYMLASLKDCLKKNKYLASLDISKNMLTLVGLRDLLIGSSTSLYSLKELIIKGVDPNSLSKLPPSAGNLIKY